jgi:hypothetical protein
MFQVAYCSCNICTYSFPALFGGAEGREGPRHGHAGALMLYLKTEFNFDYSKHLQSQYLCQVTLLQDCCKIGLIHGVVLEAEEQGHHRHYGLRLYLHQDQDLYETLIFT